MRSKFAKFISYALLAGSLLGIVLVLDDLYVVLRPQDPLGEASDGCVKGDLPSVLNGTGMVATAHVTSCSFGLAHGAETTYVYLHKSSEKDSKESLVFRFANAGNLYRPQMTWSDNSSLQILVSEVGEVTDEVALKDGVKISYSIGKEDMSREDSFRLRMREAKSSSVWLIFLTALCVLTGTFIRRQKQGSGSSTS
jgi:hypothetical protein